VESRPSETESKPEWNCLDFDVVGVEEPWATNTSVMMSLRISIATKHASRAELEPLKICGASFAANGICDSACGYPPAF
jgi:hypothetical protein